MHAPSRYALSYFVAGLIGLGLSLPASAELEEIVVTAQKREQKLQDVGIAVTAFSEGQIQELGFETSADLVAQTPGLNFVSPFGAGNNLAFTLRGVGLNDFSEANEAPIAVYVDGRYNATLAGLGFQIFDIQRAEVLRGPQGTLYGRNTTGGLVHFITKKPTREKEGHVDIGFGDNSQIRVEAAAGGPLSDSVSARASILYHKHDGYQDNVNPGVGAASETDNFSGRLQLLFEPNDSTEVLWSTHVGKADQISAAYEHQTAIFAPDGVDVVELDPGVNFYGTCAGCDLTGYRDTGGDFYETANDREPFLELDTFGTSVTVDYGNGDYDFKSITAFESVEKMFGEDTDVSPSPFIAVSNPVDSDQFSQEFHVAKSTDSSNWLLGIYYFTRDIDSGTRTDLSQETAIGFPINTNTVYTDKTDSLSLFGQYEWSLTDNWGLIAGLRYTTEERTFDMLVTDDSGILPDPVFDFTRATVGDLGKHDTDNISFRVELDYHASDDVLWYGSIARGIKGAGFNIDIGIDPRVPADIPFDEEQLLAYELGVKSTISDNARLNVSAFYYDYEDYQAFSFEGLSNVVSNKDATISGLEAEFISTPAEGWEITLGMSLLDTEVEDINTGVSIISREIPLSPEFTFNAIARYEWEAANGTFGIQLDGQYTGEQFFDILNTTIATEKAHTVANARASYTTASERSVFSIWVKNLGDEEYRTYAIPVPGLGFSQSMVGRPRWFGVSYRHNWGD